MNPLLIIVSHSMCRTKECFAFPNDRILQTTFQSNGILVKPLAPATFIRRQHITNHVCYLVNPENRVPYISI